MTTLTKVQLSLTPQEAEILGGYGLQFGYSLPKTIRYLLSKASESIVRDGNVPRYNMSAQTEKNGLNAQQEHEAGQTTLVEDATAFFSRL